MNIYTNFPVGSYVEWTDPETEDIYRGHVVTRTNHQFGIDWLDVKVEDIKLNPIRNDTFAIGQIAPVQPRHSRFKRLDLPTEANKARKSEILTELRFKPEDGVFPGGIHFQNAKNRMLKSHPEYFATRNQRRKTLRKKNS
jgi:hypothetical protein